MAMARRKDFGETGGYDDPLELVARRGDDDVTASLVRFGSDCTGGKGIWKEEVVYSCGQERGQWRYYGLSRRFSFKTKSRRLD